MANSELAGVGVLVTRPEHQATELIRAVTAHGGTAIALPVIEVVPRDANTVAELARTLREPDISIFVSANAVQYGLAHAGSAKIAVVGPATAAAVNAKGRSIDIRSPAGYDSEHLLAMPELQAVSNKVVRIIRGNGGRELLADGLRQRGAIVEYLAVYDRQVPQYAASDLEELEQRWFSGAVNVVTIMSVESLNNMLKILPERCRTNLERLPLVTPAARVIKEALNLFPGIPVTLAKGPQAGDMIKAIITSRAAQTGQP